MVPKSRPIWPITAPGMPMPGNEFIMAAKTMGGQIELVKKKSKTVMTSHTEELDQFIRECLYGQGECLINMTVKGQAKVLSVVSGHRWGANPQGPSLGPEPCDVMVISKMLNDRELQHSRILRGKPGELLIEKCRKLGITGLKDWYVTTVLKTENPDPDAKSLKPAWVSSFAHLLQQELRLVRPKFILCLGADAVKAILGKNWSVEKTRGRILDCEIPLLDGEVHKFQVMACEHPMAIIREPTKEPRFEKDLAKFGQMIQGERWDKTESGLDHRVIRTEGELRKLLAEIEKENPHKIVALDAEWHGEHPQNKGAYLRTVQISWAHKKAAAIVLTKPGGEKAFWRYARKPNGKIKTNKNGKAILTSHKGQEVAFKLLGRYLQDKRLVGHFLNADLENLVYYGLDVREQFKAAPRPELCLRQGGWDTAIMAHALDETGEFALTPQALRYTSAPRYDVDLIKWKEAYCREHDIPAKYMEGYGMCPEEVLLPYACLSADSLVQLGDGSWAKIARLVKTKYSGTVKSLYNGEVVEAVVTGWHRNAVNQKVWFRLRTDGSVRGRHGLLGPKFTPDHKVLTTRGKVRVDQLVPEADQIITDDVEMSEDQISVFLASLLGDGGYSRRNDACVGFGFGQVSRRGEYANWKADVFANQCPKRQIGCKHSVRYITKFSRYMRYLSDKWPTKPSVEHGRRKLIITPAVLAALGDLGLAVWYQDDGCLVKDAGKPSQSRIYAKITNSESELVIAWLSEKLGDGVSYNRKSKFVQIGGEAFRKFHKVIAQYMHPVMQYKTTQPVVESPVVVQGNKLFCETIREVVPAPGNTKRRGQGVRYCLSVQSTGNFLTKAGFVSNCYDADVTRRIAIAHAKSLCSDSFGNDCWEAFWNAQSAALGALEISCTGLLVDRDRLDELTTVYMAARDRLELEIRAKANWPEFNLNSSAQVSEYLFGERYNKPEADGKTRVRKRPEGAISLEIMPVISTEKRPREWDKVIQDGDEFNVSPSTGKMALGIMLREKEKMRCWSNGKWVLQDKSEEVGLIRDYRFVMQALKSTLRIPKSKEDADDDSEPFETDEHGNYVYDVGLPGVICDDTRVRTFISMLKETGRWSSSRPPLQAISKKREPDYARILRDAYKHPLRSIFEADPG